MIHLFNNLLIVNAIAPSSMLCLQTAHVGLRLCCVITGVVQVQVYMPHYTKSREVKGGPGVPIELLCSLCNTGDE